MNLKYKNTEVTICSSELKGPIEKLFQHPAAVYLVDENVYRLYPYLFSEMEERVIQVEAIESSKSFSKTEAIIEELIAKDLDRSAFLVGVGGGIVCDITGFIASIFKRGVKFGFVPTTLLAQVDASIGGKNGVNVARLKNMVGTITQPDFIWINVRFLHSLTDQQFNSGLAEVVKHACIKSKAYFKFLEDNMDSIKERNLTQLEFVVCQSVAIKTNVVESDEMETGLRKVLNFGHTFGHAIEVSKAMPHGYAVSLGMVIANDIGRNMFNLEENVGLRVKRLLEAAGLPVAIDQLKKEELRDAIRADKKRNGSTIDFVILKDIGSAQIQKVELCALK
ncbi:MAG: 3-dehydroquinate synthase [Fluviicola sp.]